MLLNATPLIAAVLLLTLLAAPVFATGAHLWFYSVDPATINPPDPLPNPEDYDPNYIDTGFEGWIAEGVAVQGDWETPFSIWLGNADNSDTSYDTTLVISVNNVAANAIVGITVEGNPVGAWDTNGYNFPLPPHGVSNSAEWYGFVEVNIGYLSAGGKVEINIDIALGQFVPDTAKLHFDAYGFSTPEHGDKPDMTSPFSHDGTFVVPEPSALAAVASSMLALGTYAYKRRKQ
jgi:hypothetical protein